MKAERRCGGSTESIFVQMNVIECGLLTVKQHLLSIRTDKIGSCDLITPTEIVLIMAPREACWS